MVANQRSWLHNLFVMSDELILLLLRMIAGGCLLAFMGLVAWFLNRDYRMALESTRMRAEVRGYLKIISSDDDSRHPVGAKLPLSPATTIGRAPTNTIQIDDTYASGEHARVIWRLGQWWLEDQHSSNGTLLNGLPVDEPIVLSAGDLIGIGNVLLRLELE